MKLYSGPLSLFTAKVRIALDEKGIAYELVAVPFGRARGYEPKHPVVLAANPKGQVPVLTDGDLTIFDSTIILEYLEDRHPEPALYPRDPADRARCRQLEAAADEILFPHVGDLIREVFFKSDAAARDETRVKAARVAIRAHYDGLEPRLGDRSWLCGDFSVADIGYFLTITFASTLGAGLTDAHPRLQTWYAGVAARPSVTKETTEMAATMAAG
jgi:glutathione S-transferase